MSDMLASAGPNPQHRGRGEGECRITLISCLMVTRGTAPRLPMVAGALAAFAAQTYAEGELVIVVDDGGDAAAVRAMAAAHASATVRIVAAPPGMTLGGLRNLAVAAARGDLVCQWDDDDLHHPQRVAAQLAALGDAHACLLGDVMMLDAHARALRWTNWAATPAGGHPATLMARRERMPPYPESGPRSSLGEDLAVWQALAAGRVDRLGGRPELYVYVSHGGNTTPAGYRAVLADSLAISRALLLRRETSLREGLAAFDLAGVTVEGANGAAFTL